MQDGQTNYSFWGVYTLKHSLKTQESLRKDLAHWLLRHDISLICCEGNELGSRFIDEFELPVLEESTFDTLVNDREEITLILQSKFHLPAHKSVSGKAVSFIILRYVRVLYDDYGNIYKEITLGYSYM